jgi:flagellar hook-associated protein 1
MSTAYSVGISALNAGQRAIDLIGQNIANATTPGYHRQVVNLTNKVVGDKVGAGVEIRRIARFTAPAIRTSVLASNSETGRLSARLDVQRQAESLFSTGSGSIDERLEQFFNGVEQLTGRPEDASQRRIVVDGAASMSNRFNELATDLADLRGNVALGLEDAIEQINTLTPKIAELNTRISLIEVQGLQANDLRDQRDQYVNDLSQYVDVRVTEQGLGVANVIGANAPLVVGDIATKLETIVDPSGNRVVRVVGNTTPLNVPSGKLAALMQEHNTGIPEYQTRLDTLAAKFIEKVNGIQATGLGATGPLAFAAGTVTVPNPATPLAAQALPFPMQAGSLAFSITNTATGTRTLQQVAVNPATDSMQDLATNLTAASGGNIQVTVDGTTNTLLFQAQPGFAFDFAGRLPTSPNAVAMGGTSVPSLSGSYTGAANDTYSFQVTGSGTIGTTPGLTMEVRNSANTVIASLNVGDGYTPGSPLLVANGVSLRLGAGTTANGSFNVPLISQPDTSGVLAALGVNGLFTGSNASSIAVRSDIAADPLKLSTSRNGDIGDTANLTRLSNLREQKVLAGGTQSYREFFGDLVGNVGNNVGNLDVLETASTNLLRNLESQEQSVVGVDINEEMLNLLQYQRMVESATRYISVVNRALDAIVEMAQ